jgi:predicted nucleic acid-binding protein
MEEKRKQIKYYLEIIDEIEKRRTRNNVNWMNILRIAIRHAPDEAIELLKNVNCEDERISELFNNISEKNK